MNTNTQTKEQRQKRFFREHFDELCEFITNSDLTHDGSPMHVLLNAYDFDQHGREKLMKKGSSKEKVEIEYEKRKANCKWRIQGIEERDVLLGIEAFFSLTSTSSGFENSLAAKFSSYRNQIFDIYFEQSRLSHEMKSEHVYLVDNELPGQLEMIFSEESFLAQILKYFGIASNNAYSIAESQIAFESFAKKYKEVTKDESCNDFDTALHLLRTVRNIYAVHRDKSEEEQNKDYVSFSKFLIADVPGALRFLIYFYVTLCTLINKAWLNANSLEESNRKKGFSIMSQSDYKNKDVFKLVNQLFVESNINVRVNIKFLPLTGHTIENVFSGDKTVDFQSGNDGSVIINGLIFSRKETPEFVVKFSQSEYKKTYKADLCKHEIWSGTTIVFREGEGVTYEYEEDEHVEPIGETNPLIADQEKATEGNAAKEEEKMSYDSIIEYYDGWGLKFYPGFYSNTSDEKENTCYLYGITSQGDKNRIVIPQYITHWRNPFIRFRVDVINLNFWNELREYGGVLVGIPENINYNIDDVPDNVEVFTDKHWSTDEKFSFKAKSGLVFNFEYKKDDECSVIGLDGEKEKQTAEAIEVPRYACGLLVTGIGDEAFAGVKTNEIILPDSVQTIGEGAFSGSSIWRMCFPEKVQKIGASVFENCKHLQTFEAAGRIETLGEYVFAGCKALKLIRLNKWADSRYSLDIHLPDGQIPKGAFKNCSELKSAYLDVKKIKEEAFMGCTGLTKVESYSPVSEEYFFTEEIGKSAFAQCDNLDSVFGVNRSEFIDAFERSPHRKKLVRVFEPNEELLPVDRLLYIMNINRWRLIIGLVIFFVTIYWVGRYFGWW